MVLGRKAKLTAHLWRIPVVRRRSSVVVGQAGLGDVLPTKLAELPHRGRVDRKSRHHGEGVLPRVGAVTPAVARVVRCAWRRIDAAVSIKIEARVFARVRLDRESMRILDRRRGGGGLRCILPHGEVALAERVENTAFGVEIDLIQDEYIGSNALDDLGQVHCLRVAPGLEPTPDFIGAGAVEREIERRDPHRVRGNRAARERNSDPQGERGEHFQTNCSDDHAQCSMVLNSGRSRRGWRRCHGRPLLRNSPESRGINAIGYFVRDVDRAARLVRPSLRASVAMT
jgi:hypothetical protein